MNLRNALVAGVALACLSGTALADGKYFYRFPGSMGDAQGVALSFPAVSGALLGGTVTSSPARMSAPGETSLSVSGGEIRVCKTIDCSSASSWSTSAVASDGAFVQVRLPGPTSPSQVVEANVTAGTRFSTDFRVVARSEAPAMTPVAAATEVPGTARDSDLSTFHGWVSTSVSVDGGEYRVCSTGGTCGSFTTAPSTIRDGDQIQLRAVAGADGTTTTVVARAGGAQLSWSLASKAKAPVADTDPDAIVFGSDPARVEPGTWSTSSIARLTGHTGVPVSIEGGEYQVCAQADCSGAVWTTEATASVANGAWVRVRVRPTNFGASATTTLRAGSVRASWSATARDKDETPDAFSLGTGPTGAEPASVSTSQVATLAGFDDAPISIAGTSAEYSLNGGAFTSAAGTARPGDTVAVRATAGTFGETRTAVLSVGGTAATFAVAARPLDGTPDDIVPGIATANQEPGAESTWPATTLAGFDEAPISISGVGSSYSVNGGAFTTASGVVKGGDTVVVRLAVGSFGETRTAKLSVGGVTADYVATARAKDTAPNTFSLGTGPTGVEPGTVSTSASTTLSGFDDAPISIAGTGAEYSLNDAAFTTVAGTAKTGDSVRVRLTAGALGETRVATLSVGGTTATWSSTVRAKDTTPDVVAFAAKADGVPSSPYLSEIRRLTGHEGIALSVSGTGSSLRVCSEATCATGTIGEWVTSVAEVQANSYVQLRQVAGAVNETRTVVLSYGTLVAEWKVTAVSQDPRQISGDLYAWGDGANGKLGNGSAQSLTPSRIPLPTGVSSFARPQAFGQTACSLASDGGVYCWGKNDLGQIGDGTTTNRAAPTKVSFPTGVTSFTDLTVGDGHACAQGSDSAIYCWGSNYGGEIGDGSVTARSKPVKVTLPVGVSRLSKVVAGWYSTCAIGNDGNGYCWGQNTRGEVGDGTTNDRPIPTKVSNPVGTTGFKEITEGHYGRCGIASDDATYCWGDGSSGQIGDGSKTSRTLPTKVQLPVGVTRLKDLVSGQYMFCGTGSDDASYCWGINAFGGLGDGTTTDRTVPTKVTPPAGVASIRVSDGGVYKTCGVGSDGNAYCWGWNSKGELGDGTTTNRSTPTRVLVPNGVVGFGLPSSGNQSTYAIAK